MKLTGLTAIIAFALIAGAAAPTLSLSRGIASAAVGAHLQVAFTKWAIGDTDAGAVPGDGDGTDMIGFVGGDVGQGTFFGEVFSFVPNGPNTLIDAVYHIHGSKASLVAAIHVISNNATGVADVSGTVVEIDGAPAAGTVDGSFRTKTPCPIAPPAGVPPDSTCFSGTLNVRSS